MMATAVVSKTLATVAYDGTRRLLRLEFRSGAVYDYFDVPSDVHQGLMEANSHGGYFNRNIRGRFRYHQVRGGQPRSKDLH
jgi:hypothetical protein